MNTNLVDLFKELLEANGLGFFGFHFPALHCNLFVRSSQKGFPFRSGLD